MNDLRECLYKGERYRFHGFFQRAYTHEGALTIGGFPAGQEAFPVAVIEHKDGSVVRVAAELIWFVVEESEVAK